MDPFIINMDLFSIPAWIDNYVHYGVWDEIANPFLNFNGCNVEAWEWMSNFTPHFIGHVITKPYWDYK